VDPDSRWDGGPFAEPARCLLAPHAAEISDLTEVFRRLIAATAATRAIPVVTHSEPHPANLLLVDGRTYLIDWDTVALACPERDLAVVTAAGGACGERYREATGREVDPQRDRALPDTLLLRRPRNAIDATSQQDRSAGNVGGRP
jgi:spectinomycin phosphotransferase